MIISPKIQNPSKTYRANMETVGVPVASVVVKEEARSAGCERTKLFLEFTNLRLKKMQIRSTQAWYYLNNGSFAGRTRRPIWSKTYFQLKMKFETTSLDMSKFASMMTNNFPSRRTGTRTCCKSHLIRESQRLSGAGEETCWINADAPHCQ